MNIWRWFMRRTAPRPDAQNEALKAVVEATIHRDKDAVTALNVAVEVIRRIEARGDNARV